MDARAWSNIQEMMHQIYDEEKEDKSLPIEFWHYSSLNGILGMFQKYIESNDGKIDACEMWASNIRFMNDSKEYEIGRSFFENHINEGGYNDTETIVSDNIYLISFCEDGDLLSQWKWYGKNSGISVRFEMDNISFCTYKSKEKDKDIAGSSDERLWDTNTKPISVKYTQEEKTDYFKRITKEDFLGSKKKELIGSVFIPFCKDAGFKEERERRLVFFVCDEIPYTTPEKKFVFDYVYNKNEEGRTKPALNVHMKADLPYVPFEDDGSLSVSEKKNIISEMIVGPGVNQEMVFNCLIHAFDRTHYSYHPLSVKHEEDAIEDFENFKNKPSDYLLHFVRRKTSSQYDDVTSLCYKCENGLIISTSRIPFRG